MQLRTNAPNSEAPETVAVEYLHFFFFFKTNESLSGGKILPNWATQNKRVGLKTPLPSFEPD